MNENKKLKFKEQLKEYIKNLYKKDQNSCKKVLSTSGQSYYSNLKVESGSCIFILTDFSKYSLKAFGIFLLTTIFFIFIRYKVQSFSIIFKIFKKLFTQIINIQA